MLIFIDGYAHIVADNFFLSTLSNWRAKDNVTTVFSRFTKSKSVFLIVEILALKTSTSSLRISSSVCPGVRSKPPFNHNMSLTKRK